MKDIDLQQYKCITNFLVMKKHLLAALSVLALAAAGCKEETKNYPPATVEIQNIVPQDVSVQFELAHTNAVLSDTVLKTRTMPGRKSSLSSRHLTSRQSCAKA